MATRENGPFPSLPGWDADPGHPSARHAMRIGDAERDVAAHELGEHYVAGRLTLDELHDRLGLVLSARTRGQLTRVMADLPASRKPASPVPGWPAGRTPAVPAAGVPTSGVPAQVARARREQAGDTVSQVAAVALLLLAMLIWLFTVMLFTSHG